MSLPTGIPTTPAELRQWLQQKIAAVPATTAGEIDTGWGEIDTALRRGATHEWFGLENSREWIPPLCVLAHVAKRSMQETGWSVWIGRRIWPSIHTLGAAWQRTLLIDPSSESDRVWSIDVALRCSGMTVVADGSRMKISATRRFQLAAEAGGSVGLIARPPPEMSQLSTACSRWQVNRVAGKGDSPRWSVELIRCKGVSSLHHRKMLLELGNEGLVVPVSSDLSLRPGATTPEVAGGPFHIAQQQRSSA